MRGMWLCATLVAATLVAATCHAQTGGQDWADVLFRTGGDAESVKTETADPPKIPTPTLSKGDKGDRGDPGEAGQAGAPGKDGKNGKSGATRVIRRTVVVRQIQAPVQPAPVNGHIGTPGHKGVYREIKDWHPASTGRVDARDAQLSSRIAGETRMRQRADEDVRRKAKEGDERVTNNMMTSILLVCLLIAAAFFCGARRFGR